MPAVFVLQEHPPKMLSTLRQRAPLVQCLQTPVSMDITANVLLAAGAAPAMVCSEEETPAFLPKADALYVNMGTLNAARVREIAVAIAEASRLKKPWVLDPVACGSTPHRTEHCAKAMGQRPTIVRGNGSEIIALAAASCSKTPAPSGSGPRGADSTDKSSAALPAAEALAREFGAVVVVSGELDIITDGKSPALAVHGGSKLLTKITGVGCALSALAAAFLGASPQLPLEAAVAACAMMSTAAEGSAHTDPSNLRVHLIARLHTIMPAELASTSRVQVSDTVAADTATALPAASQETCALTVQVLEEGVATSKSQLMFHPVILHLVLKTCPANVRTQLCSSLHSLVAAASSPDAAQPPDTLLAVTECAHLMHMARQGGRGGEKLVALGVMRMFLLLGETLQQAWALLNCTSGDEEAIWPQALVESTRRNVRALEEALSKDTALVAFAASPALVGEATAYYEGGVEAVTRLLHELDATAAPEGGGGGGGGSSSGMQMMAPACWDRARETLGKVVGVRPAVLYARAPRVLIVAGSDSSGGAGIQADIKACQAMGAYAMTAISALTAQNTTGVQGVMGVPCDFLEQQIHSCLLDIRADVVKTGMLATPEAVECVCRAVGRDGLVKWVVDPVMVATSGHELVGGEAVAAIKKHLFPVAHIITPNLPETALLLRSGPIRGVDAMIAAAKELAAMGPRWVLVKGGHMEGGTCADVLLEGSSGKVTVLEGRYLESEHTHGTGCTLASSIAALLAQGLSTVEAVTRAKRYVWDAIRFSQALGLGSGHGPLNHQYQTAHWASPWSERSLARARTPLYRGKLLDYSLYGVTDDGMIAAQGLSLAAAVEASVRGGVTVVQLRQKNLDSAEMLKAAATLLPICRQHGVPLIINDRVDIALACDADGVHVGQDDLPCAVVRRMLGPHKIVGVSVKTAQEVAQAERDGADYVGSGAVYPTSTKDSSAIGLEGLAVVCRGSQLPVVAIGGLTSANCHESIRAGAVGIAVVSAIYNQPDPRAAAQTLAAALKAANSTR